MDRPVLAIPVINRPDLFARCLASIDIPVRLMVIDNSPDGLALDLVPDDALLVDAPWNMGVAASWNLAIKAHPAEPWWLVANADTELAPGDLSRLVRATESGEWGWVGVAGDWRIFGLTAAAVERVGLFDEGYYPVFCEDADYERRCTLAGVRWGFIDGATTHVGSVCLEGHRADNARTYPDNVQYHVRKWGGGPRAETFTTPFAAGGPLDAWTLDVRRLRDNRWRGDGSV